MNSNRPQEPKQQQPGLFQIVGSVLAAAFGVQSRRNRVRDFKHGKARTFIIAGVLFTVMLVLTLYLLVWVLLRVAGPGAP